MCGIQLECLFAVTGSLNIGEIVILHLSIDVDLMLKISEINRITSFYEVFNIVYSTSHNLLLASSDNGLLGWFVDDCHKEM